jgi:prepilin-type processing-associated H-X9-DG protein
MRALRAFSLVELLAVCAIIGLLIVCLLATLPSVRAGWRGSQCSARFRTLGQATIQYAQENDGKLPSSSSASISTLTYGQQGIWYDYRKVISPYLELSPARETSFFCCPASGTNQMTYLFNGANEFNPNFKGLAGKRLPCLGEPARTLLLVEFPVLVSRSFHVNRGRPSHNDSQSYACFADGHVGLQKFFWNGAPVNAGINPPPQYGYLWGE